MAVDCDLCRWCRERTASMVNCDPKTGFHRTFTVSGLDGRLTVDECDVFAPKPPPVDAAKTRCCAECAYWDRGNDPDKFGRRPCDRASSNSTGAAFAYMVPAGHGERCQSFEWRPRPC
jgi:hypothetical protein